MKEVPVGHLNWIPGLRQEVTTYTHLTFSLEEHVLKICFMRKVVGTFAPLFLLFLHALTVHVIQEASNMCCSTYVGSMLTVIDKDIKDKVKEDNDPIMKDDCL